MGEDGSTGEEYPDEDKLDPLSDRRDADERFIGAPVIAGGEYDGRVIITSMPIQTDAAPRQQRPAVVRREISSFSPRKADTNPTAASTSTRAHPRAFGFAAMVASLTQTPSKSSRPAVIYTGTARQSTGSLFSLESLARNGAVVIGKIDSAGSRIVTLQPNAAEHIKFGDVDGPCPVL